MIRIVSKREGFRRCGVAHSRTAVDYADDHWSEEELERLKAEPMLVVTEGLENEDVVIDDIVEAIGNLPIDEKLWSQSTGKPHVTAIEEAMGVNISSVQRDEAWEIIQKKNEDGK